MKLYISGGISGITDYRERFAAAQKQLEGAGYTVENPAAYGFPDDIPWHLAMKYDLARMLECDGVALLDDWEKSCGACCEAGIATDIQMDVRRIEEWIQQAREI